MKRSISKDGKFKFTYVIVDHKFLPVIKNTLGKKVHESFHSDFLFFMAINYAYGTYAFSFELEVTILIHPFVIRFCPTSYFTKPLNKKWVTTVVRKKTYVILLQNRIISDTSTE